MVYKKKTSQMKCIKAVLIILLTCTGYHSYGQKNWSLISESDLGINPNKNILKIQPINEDTLLGGTGFFISETCILTNRHLVFNSNNSVLHKSILISAGFIGYDTTPIFGSQKINMVKNVNVFLPENFHENGNDFALIKLQNDSLYRLSFQNEPHFPFRLIPFSADNIEQKQLNITGFTGWKWKSDKKPKGRLYNAKVKYIKSLNNGEIQYKASSVRGGNSGSPIWIKNGDYYDIVGIHRRGAAKIPEILGKRHGVAWTKEKIELITNWMNQ